MPVNNPRSTNSCQNSTVGIIDQPRTSAYSESRPGLTEASSSRNEFSEVLGERCRPIKEDVSGSSNLGAAGFEQPADPDGASSSVVEFEVSCGIPISVESLQRLPREPGMCSWLELGCRFVSEGRGVYGAECGMSRTNMEHTNRIAGVQVANNNRN